MLLSEWNMKDALEVAKEESREETLEEVFALLEGGMSLEEAKKRSGFGDRISRPSGSAKLHENGLVQET
jgi:hypothetical protein